MLKASGKLGAIHEGRLTHDLIMIRGLDLKVMFGNTLVDVHAKCGAVIEAHKLFDWMPSHSVFSWGALIAGYSQQGHGLIAFQLFESMHQEGICPDRFMFLSTLKDCGNLEATKQGSLIHVYIIVLGIEMM